ncbi:MULTISPECIES: ribose-5-phosphate isomerase RpiA [Staphylococcus]|uniref:ribose-5-phosphate isomerase RpiA n=1 Tax=Staphylococcus TaxID=1279 RepID=UPI000D1E4418|nr:MULTISPECIES: ribose-5-phosphate isomerase RpiA [Staphylococcus]KAB2476767.1 ribose-5-phosphate isomerase RpiA [Staphylococcus sp. CH99b_3]PTK94502.1 ribose 5-phosphate isomerase A [Staphylococcus gallinarum]PTK94546.1 ribose 5-phosphate isomerase A [Staphylococcus gallinarum]RIO87551.1 ribose-5-phosphate isomerase RpiA [Staphylococcus gallinarum]
MNNNELKKRVAKEAIMEIDSGMTIGLGSGSTMKYVLEYLSSEIKSGLDIIGIPTSVQTAQLAHKLGIPLTSFSKTTHIDIAIDGADEVDSNFNLIKGGGGALIREKIIGDAANKFIIVIDKTKLVEQLGIFPLPVEVIPFGWEITSKHIQSLGASCKLRQINNKPYVTDNGNYILDCNFGFINSPLSLTTSINSIVGVIDSGLFINMADKVLVSDENTVRTIFNKSKRR